MTGSRNAFGREYASALERYLQQGDEVTLSVAYELGRRAVSEGLGVLDMAVLHEDAVESLTPLSSPSDEPRIAAAAGGFFRELLSPFEMSFRGYRGANEQLQRLNETLLRQKEAVELANRELESFSYSVSHDLRAPLRSIDGFSLALLEDYGDKLDEQGKKYLGHVRDAAQRMAQLIDDLLGLARVTRSEMIYANVDMTALVRRIAGRLQATMPERDVHFDIQEGVSGHGDARLLTVVLENLLGNAWKFTSKRESGKIEFALAENRGKPTYFVRDNGAGFDMAYADKLFGAFQRLHSESDFEGTGIGLATVQRVIHRHGGRVWAEGSVGVGATFYFTLGEGGGDR
jgi:light-regulated signal transduction histidine kinase (bacteriophytochrome)